MKRALLACLAVWGSGGCMFGPDYERPALEMPTAFRGDAEAEAKAAASLADLKWFEVFKDPRLQEFIRAAVEGNLDLQAAVARIEAAGAVLGITRSELFPTVTAGASLTAFRASRNGATPIPAGIENEREYGTVGVGLLSYEFDVWGRIRRATESARAQLLASEEGRKAVLTALVADVAATYFTLLALDLEMEISQRTLTARRNSLELIRLRARGGLATELDLRQGEQLVYGAEQAIPELERLLEQGENLLSLLLGKSPGPMARGRSLTEQTDLPQIPPGLPSTLLERRPDVRAAEWALVSATAEIGVAEAERFPRISLTAFFGAQSDQFSELLKSASRAWEVVPAVSVPLFTGGRIDSQIDLALARRNEALAGYRRVVLAAFREVSDALIEHRKTREVRVVQELLVATLRERARLSYLRYHGGVDSLLSALDADRDLFNAELTLTRKRLGELLSVVRLYRALGGGWQE